MHKPPHQMLVIFGASGDLTRRKLIPALFNLHRQGLLPGDFVIMGSGRTEHTDESFRDLFRESLEENDPEAATFFLQHLFYHPADQKSKEDFAGLAKKIETLNKKWKLNGNRIFYLATPPGQYIPIACQLAGQGLNLEKEPDGFTRMIIEKPFGHDLKSAQALNRNLKKHFGEHQLFRIDHYLGKETVQNILVTRFSNGIFEPLWNRNYIHHVEITSAEDMGVESRGTYYEQSGALRDMIQNHLLQLVCLAAMEPPTVIEPGAIRNEMLKVLQSLRPYTEAEIPEHVIRGQYMASRVRGKDLTGYREEKGVDPVSRVETYVAMKFYIDNWRWGGVPFYIRTGKRLPLKATEIVIHFKPTPHKLFRKEEGNCSTCNQMIIRIQPDEGILLKFAMKIPGAGFRVQDVNMDFHYSDLSSAHLPDAYERLLLDAMNGDATLFSRSDVVEAAWAFVDPILRVWESNHDIPLHGYPSGTWGPDVADHLIEEPALTWRYPCRNLSEDTNYCEL
ncbi:MAG: glucose-6-phosphate dehydrogenase [Bacteroidales bacterium]